MPQCPNCGHPVPDIFHHVAIDCEHDMTPEEIDALLTALEASTPAEVDYTSTEMRILARMAQET